MNAMEDIAGGALLWLCHTSLAAAVLVFLVLLIQSICGRWIPPRWTYTLWLLVVVRLVLPIAPKSPFSLFNLYTRVSGPAPELRVAPPAKPVTSALKLPPKSVLPSAAKPGTHLRLTVVIAAAWLCGVVAYLLCCLLQYQRLVRWARHQRPLCDPRLVALLRKAQQTLDYRRPVTLLASQSLAVPSVLGIARPSLLLPQHVLETWNEEELKLAMLHELVHVRRRDNLLNWGLIVVQALHWFNPMVWFALRRLRSEREALCDAIVLNHIDAEERRSYGAVLIKAAEQITSAHISPALVPIINQKHEIQRRIRMITRFKPTPRVISICAGVVVLALGCVTFTGAAQKEKKPAPKITNPKEDEQAKNYERGMKLLDEELNRINQEIGATEKRMDRIRLELGIPSYIAQGDGSAPGPETETIRKLQALKVDATSEYQHLADLHKQLTAMSRPDLRKAIPVVLPDQQLGLLFERLADAEQKFVSLTERYASEHPEVKTAQRTMDKIQQQIEERLEGVLAGLHAKTAAAAARIEQISAELEKKVARDVDAPIRYRPYFSAKREMEGLLLMRDRLYQRLMEEKINAAIPPGKTQAILAR